MLVVNFCGVQQRIFLGCRIPEKFAGMVTHGSNANAYQRNSLARFSLHHSLRTREIRMLQQTMLSKLAALQEDMVPFRHWHDFPSVQSNLRLYKLLFMKLHFMK
jgi:hypothetical protein